MRRATSDAGWLDDSEIGFYGVALGYDFCAEHEQGASFFKSQMGITQTDFPLGVGDRTQTQVPPQLELIEYTSRAADKRVNTTKPAALMHCSRIWGVEQFQALSLEAKASFFEVTFWNDWKSKRYDETRDDFVSSWASHDGFALNVRGEKNVAKLKALYDAFQAGTVALADPSVSGFQRKSLCFVLTEKLSEQTKADTLASDTAHKHLYDCAKASGIEETLKAVGLWWYALSPAWRDGPDSELLFFLNPREQKKYAHGWFTLPELTEWSQGKGPVVDGNAIDEFLKTRQKDWRYHLLGGLNSAGIGMRVHPSYVWLDALKTKVGVRILVSKDTPKELMTDGLFPLEALQPYVDADIAATAAQNASAVAS
jgi:hypothetical protein